MRVAKVEKEKHYRPLSEAAVESLSGVKVSDGELEHAIMACEEVV